MEPTINIWESARIRLDRHMLQQPRDWNIVT